MTFTMSFVLKREPMHTSTAAERLTAAHAPGPAVNAADGASSASAIATESWRSIDLASRSGSLAVVSAINEFVF